MYLYLLKWLDRLVISNLLQLGMKQLNGPLSVNTLISFTNIAIIYDFSYYSDYTLSFGPNVVHLFIILIYLFIRILCVSAFRDSQPQPCMASRNPNHLRPYLIYGELFDFILGVESNGIKEWVVLR